MLSLSTTEQVEHYAAQFRDAQPFRHVVIDDFLHPQAAQALLDQFPGFDTRFALNEMGQVGGKAVRTRVRDLGPQFAALDDYIQTPEFLDAISRITGIPDLLYDPDYEGGGTHENREGQGLDVHVDFNYHPRTGWHRRLNLIVYLHPEWESAWGGNLQLVRDPWQSETDGLEVVPTFNRCVLFETNEVSWHGFDQIRLPPERQHDSRKSFAIYLYTRERPAQETAPPHATIYVPPGMPGDVPPGQVLDDERHTRLRVGFARLRAQLRFLYERETQFTAQIAALERALDEARAAQKIDLQGYSLQHGASGCWPDGWCGSEFRLRFEPTRVARGLTLDLWVPDALTTGQTLAIRIGDVELSRAMRAGESATLTLGLRAAAGAVVDVSIRSLNTWTPSRDGSSRDERPLAFRLLRAALEH